MLIDLGVKNGLSTLRKIFALAVNNTKNIIITRNATDELRYCSGVDYRCIPAFKIESVTYEYLPGLKLYTLRAILNFSGNLMRHPNCQYMTLAIVYNNEKEDSNSILQIPEFTFPTFAVRKYYGNDMKLNIRDSPLFSGLISRIDRAEKLKHPDRYHASIGYIQKYYSTVVFPMIHDFLDFECRRDEANRMIQHKMNEYRKKLLDEQYGGLYAGTKYGTPGNRKKPKAFLWK